jgi:hypothetical protein
VRGLPENYSIHKAADRASIFRRPLLKHWASSFAISRLRGSSYETKSMAVGSRACKDASHNIIRLVSVSFLVFLSFLVPLGFECLPPLKDLTSKRVNNNEASCRESFEASNHS